jgi:hypothetical protein
MLLAKLSSFQYMSTKTSKDTNTRRISNGLAFLDHQVICGFQQLLRKKELNSSGCFKNQSTIIKLKNKLVIILLKKLK